MLRTGFLVPARGSQRAVAHGGSTRRQHTRPAALAADARDGEALWERTGGPDPLRDLVLGPCAERAVGRAGAHRPQLDGAVVAAAAARTIGAAVGMGVARAEGSVRVFEVGLRSVSSAGSSAAARAVPRGRLFGSGTDARAELTYLPA
jgi:hypothetical protein